MSILAIGISVYDTTIVLNDPLIIDNKHRVGDIYENTGGQATNAACVCSKFGIPTYMISRIGKDVYGKHILDTFHAFNIDTSYMLVLDDYKTSCSIILNHTDIGKRTILNYQDIKKDVPFDLPSNIQFLILDAHEEEIGLKALHTYKNIPSMLDAERVNDLTLKYAKEVDYLVCSEKFACDYTKLDCIPSNYEDIISKIKELNHKQVVVTLGENGLIYDYNGEIKHMKAYPNVVVDSTGAGDIFHGALAYALHENYNFEDALYFATITASLSITKKGSCTSIPSLLEVLTIYNKKRGEI